MENKSHMIDKVVQFADKYSYTLLFLELVLAYIFVISKEECKLYVKIGYVWACIFAMILIKYWFYFLLWMPLENIMYRHKYFIGIYRVAIWLIIIVFFLSFLFSIFLMIVHYEKVPSFFYLISSTAVLSGAIRFKVKNDEKINDAYYEYIHRIK